MPPLHEAPQFLSYDELRLELENFSYRPGWDLSVFLDPWEGPCLYVVVDVDDAYSPGDSIELRIRSNIPPIPSAAYFAVWLAYRLQLIELHESREYFRHVATGRPVFDPHDVVEPGSRKERR